MRELRWSFFALLVLSMASMGCIFFGEEEEPGGAVLINESVSGSGGSAKPAGWTNTESFNTTYGGVTEVVAEDEKPQNETIGGVVYGADNPDPEELNNTLPSSESPHLEQNESDEAPEENVSSRWGTECEDDFDCSFSNMEACVFGHCEVQECIFTSDCPEGKDHCYDGRCFTEAALYSKFEQCGLGVECTGSCYGCRDGKEDCIITGHSEGDEQVDYYICVDCTSDYGCKPGYRCVKSQCVLDESSS